MWGHLGLGHINPIHNPTLLTTLSQAADASGSSSPKAGGEGVKVLDIIMGFNHTLYLVAPRSSSATLLNSVHKFGGDPQPYPLPSPGSVDAPKGRIFYFYATFSTNHIFL